MGKSNIHHILGGTRDSALIQSNDQTVKETINELKGGVSDSAHYEVELSIPRTMEARTGIEPMSTDLQSAA